jgi:FixJ family two-component response regulator
MAEPSNIVAVIDDDDLLRDALEQLLDALGYASEFYDSATSFLAAIGSSKARCLLVDVQLGPVCGLELGRSLAAAGFKFSIIYMTASADESIRQRAVDAGCVAFLHKPFAWWMLVNALNTAGVRPAED